MTSNGEFRRWRSISPGRTVFPGYGSPPPRRTWSDTKPTSSRIWWSAPLALDAFVVAGILAATSVAREFETRTLAYLKLSPTHPLVPLAGRLLATGAASATAIAAATLLVVAGYGVIPGHPAETAAALLLRVVIFSCIGAGVGTLVRRTLPLPA